MEISSNKPKIGVDIDDTLLDFVGAFVRYHNERYKTRLKKVDFTSYSFDTAIGGTMNEAVEKVYELCMTNFFRERPPFSNAVKTINSLKQTYELFIVTSRPDYLLNQTIEWINRHFSNSFSNIFFSSNHYTGRENSGKSKAEICLDKKISFMIDDSLEYCNQCSEKGVEALLFGNLPWNQDGKFGDKIRVNNWLEVGERLLK